MSLGDRLSGLFRKSAEPEAHPRDKRRAFEAALREGRYDALAGIVGKTDPYKHGALFIAVDFLLEAGLTDDLGALADLVDHEHPLAHRVWRALTAFYRGDKAALDDLHAIRDDQKVPGGMRESGPAWAIYATSKRFEPTGGAPSGPPIMQFWDKADVPEDVEALIAGWKALAGADHHLFDAAMAADYLRDTYGATEAAIFAACPHPAIQSDYFRLGYIANEGGIYVDADAKMRPGFGDLWPSMTGRTVLWFRTHVPRAMFNNGLIAAPAGARLFADTFVEAGRRLRETPEAHVLSLAGPATLRTVLVRLADEGTLDPIETVTSTFARTRLFAQADLAYKRDNRDWKRWNRDGRPGA